MDAFDFSPDPDEKPQRNVRDLILKLGAYYFLAGSLCLIGFFIVIYLNPNISINPFPPSQPISREATATNAAVVDAATATAAAQLTETSAVPAETSGAAETPTPTFTATATGMAETAAPTTTPTPYPTATNVVLMTDTPAPTVDSAAHFVAQDGTPSYLPYSGGCNGIYVAGYVIDSNNNPLVHMTVRAVGVVGEQRINVEALSGSNTNYTESGWELKLLDSPADTTGKFSIALYKQGALDPVSDTITFDTYGSCTQNLIVINFVQEE